MVGDLPDGPFHYTMYLARSLRTAQAEVRRDRFFRIWKIDPPVDQQIRRVIVELLDRPEFEEWLGELLYGAFKAGEEYERRFGTQDRSKEEKMGE